MNRTRLQNLLIIVLTFMLMACQQPDFQSINGQAVNLKDNQGRWLVINLWAEWCGPCRGEIPELNDLYTQGKIRVIGHDFDDVQGQTLKTKVTNMGIHFPVIAENPISQLTSEPPQALPANYIISAEGKLIDIMYGSQTHKSIERHVNKLQKK